MTEQHSCLDITKGQARWLHAQLGDLIAIWYRAEGP
jgi:hypothetical protein